MANDCEHSYLKQGYYHRLFLSFAVAVILFLVTLWFLPGSDEQTPEHRIKNVIIDLYDLSLEDRSAESGGGGGGGGASAPPADVLKADPLRNALPVPVKIAEADTSATVPQPTGTGEGSGIGTGQGSGIGSGQGDGIGDGIGSGRGSALQDTLPPRPLVQVMPEHPRSGPDRKAVGIVKLKIKVNDRGKVEEVEVVFNSTNSKACEQKAIEAVRQSRYQPARVQLRSVAAWTVVEYGFNSTTSH